jgi:hypothetical protein
MSLTFLAANLILLKIMAGFFMSIKSRDVWKIGIWFLLLAVVFVAIILPLLSAGAPDAITAVTFTLILILGILFALSFNPQQLVCTAYHFGIRPRSPPNR